MRVVIIDDEPFARETLTIYLNRFKDKIDIIGEASNATTGHELIKNTNPDLVFLDIEMPGGNGFDLLSKFNEISFYVIFTTAYDQYAIKAIKYAALDYILKPINPKELEEALRKADKRLKWDKKLNVDALLDSTQSRNKTQKIILPVERDRYESVLLTNIFLVRADGSYCTFYLKDGSTIMTSKNIKEYEDLFENTCLIRVHKSTIINIYQVKTYIKGDGGEIILNNGEKVNVSRSRKDDFLSKFNK